MGVIVRRNERSWAIVIISEIKSMLKGLNLKIKSVGGESTLSVNKQSMFPDVLLYEDEAQTKILQGWELKMPDVKITDEAFIEDAARKADTLGVNSFVIWNFTYGKLYVKDENGAYRETKTWSGTNHIRTREDVTTYREEWLPVIKEIVITVNEYLVRGQIAVASIETTISDGLMTEVIQRNKELVAEKLMLETSRNMHMESRLKIWWHVFRKEYDQDEANMYSAYAKSILLHWTNRIMFANTIKKFHNCAYLISQLDSTSAPGDGNMVMEQIIRQGDFYNVFQKMEYDEVVPEDTWIDIVDFNQFLVENNIEQINQAVLQDILEKTVHTAKREIRGQFATPYSLADILCQITVTDWHSQCADLCAGTGTIAKAAIQNKAKRLHGFEAAFQTTWISDKFAYPLQIANIAVTDIHAVHIPLNMFQSDVFALRTGDKITIKNPGDGSDMERIIPAFDVIMSNLPFVEYNKIAVDEIEYLKTLRDEIKRNTGIEFKAGKTDLYNYFPFKLHGLLAEDGKLGIILSNSWLGTNVGRQFYEALKYYFHIQSVVVSNCKRWFQNARVVATILVLQKKKISPQEKNARTDFWLLHKDINNLRENEKETIIHSIVSRVTLDKKAASFMTYSNETIEQILNKGISLNALFHDVSWVDQLAGSLIPVERMLVTKRGERRGKNELFYPEDGNCIEKEYLLPVLKRPASLKSYKAHPDLWAFCCHESKEELKRLGHMGALNWIEKFENMVENGKPLPEKLKRAGAWWYEMDDSTKADLVTAINPDKRLFVARFDEATFVDQRFTRMLYKSNSVSRDLIFALLNSVYGMFAIEALGFGRGLGVLDASSTKLKNMYMINPGLISQKDEREIIELFDKIKDRDVMNVEDELKDRGRERFDRKVLSAVGCENLYEPIKQSLLTMQHTRHAVK